MLTEIELFFKQSNKAVLNGNFDLGASLYSLTESTGSLNSEGFPAGIGLVLVT